MFEAYLNRWRLRPDGAAIHTHSSDLLPVRFAGTPAMLKVPREEEERRGGLLLSWWDGNGAVRVLARDAETGALLMERPRGARSLARMARSGPEADDDATRVLCGVAARLHAPRAASPPELTPLNVWFRVLPIMAARYGGVLLDAASTARELLDTQANVTALHGDLHHENVLDGGQRGWLAIDPKGLVGERTFDFANVLNNPDADVARRPGRLARQVRVIADAAQLDARRLLRWVLAYSGLSAAWWLEDGREDRAAAVLDVARVAAAELALSGTH